MPQILAPLPVQRFVDNNGNALVGGQLFTYQAGSSTPAPTYTDSTGVTANSNPVLMNSRGECNVWLPPNVSYKFVLQDSLGNTLWTVDQIVNSQLTTLYGGVDTGVANAYVLTFAAPFTAYADGEIIYWIPSNANTGPSTINVNGLGTIALVNPNGSPLVAGQISANLVAAILIKGGQALLIQGGSINLLAPGSVAAPSLSFIQDNQTGLYQPLPGFIGIALSGQPGGIIAAGNVTGTLSGLTTTVNVTGTCAASGNLASVSLLQASGTSNNVNFTANLTLPGGFLPAKAQWVNCTAMTDNGAAIYSQVGTIAASGSPIPTFLLCTFYKGGNASGWTNSGTKGIGDLGNTQVRLTFSYQLS